MPDPSLETKQPATSIPQEVPEPKDSLLFLVRSAIEKSGHSSKQASTLFQKKDQFPTGIDTVDKALNGGVNGITILAGRPGVGKTAFLSQVAVKAVQNHTDNAVVIYSLDMSRMEFVQRLMIAATAKSEPQIEKAPGEEIVAELSDAAMSRVIIKESFSSQVCRELSADEKRRIIAFGKLNVEGVNIDEDKLRMLGNGEHHTVSNTVFPTITLTRSFLDGSSIVQDCKPLCERKDIRNLMIIIDLFQDIRCAEQHVGNRHDDQILERLKENELKLRSAFPNGDVSFLISSAVRKESNSKGGQPSNIGMDDVIGSTNLGYSADMVLGLNLKSELNDAENIVVLDVLKGRDGVTRGPIDLLYQFKTGQFSSKTQEKAKPKKSPAKKRRDDLRS